MTTQYTSTSKVIVLRASDRTQICTGKLRFSKWEAKGLQLVGPVMEIAVEDKLKPIVLDHLSSSETFILILEDKTELTAVCRYPDHFSGVYYFTQVNYE